jgi:DNA-binding transcriptional regulator LsrR (DeoR family)
MINVDDWAEIRRLYFAGEMGMKSISRQLGIARNTVRSAVRSESPPRYVRRPVASLADAG